MKTKRQIKLKIKELDFYCKSYKNSPIPEGIIFMKEGLKWVLE